MSGKNIEHIATADQNFAQTYINSYHCKLKLMELKCTDELINLLNKLPNSGKVIDLYIFNTLDQWSRDVTADFTLNICLFWSIKRTKNLHPDK